MNNSIQFKINFLEWPKYSDEKTFTELALKIVQENNIQEGDIVGGSSLGGMIAIEIAKQKKLKAVILIGSAISRNEIQGILTLLAPLAFTAPISLIQLLIGKYDNIVTKMFASTETEFIRSMCQYLPKWLGIVEGLAPIFRLHGQNDHIIPCPSIDCEIIKGAGHLVAITHPKECAYFLNKLNIQIGVGNK
jgi:pimeloyl-ACP methyl ester carboxylesterase